MRDVVVIIGSSPDGTVPVADRAALANALRCSVLEPSRSGREQGEGSSERSSRVDRARERIQSPHPITLSRGDGVRGAVRVLVPPGDIAAARYAAAAGAADVSVLMDSAGLKGDVVIIGIGGAGDDGDLLAGALAERLGAVLLLDVIEVRVSEHGLSVTRDLGRGARDVWNITGPVVLVMAAEPATPPYVSRYRLQAARIAPHSAAATSAETSTAAWEPARPRAKSNGGPRAESATDRLNDLFGAAPSAAAATSEDTIIHANARNCAQHLVRYLRHHGFIAPSESAPEPSPISGGGRGQGEGVAHLNRNARHLTDRTDALTPTLLRKERGPDASDFPWLRRVPRPLDGSTRGLHRRPVPLRPQLPESEDSRQTRCPRSVTLHSSFLTPAIAAAMSRRPRPMIPSSTSPLPSAILPARPLTRAPRPIGDSSTLHRRPRPLS